MKYQDLSLDQIREAIPFIVANAKAAMSNEAYDLAHCLQDKAESLWDELVRRIQKDDPHTTEADIRYFEGNPLF
jgi:hypothetical protein